MLSRHALTASDFQILIKLCSIESRNEPSPKSEVVHEAKFSLQISYSSPMSDLCYLRKPRLSSLQLDQFHKILFYLLIEPLPETQKIPHPSPNSYQNRHVCKQINSNFIFR